MKPVLYLDVDDTLLMFPPWRTREWWAQNKGGAPADEVQEFLEWARETFEVRWLTMWAMRGAMHPELEEELAHLLKIPPQLIADCHNPIDWGATPGALKTAGINWDEHNNGREWFWVEDGIGDREWECLQLRRCFDRFVKTNTSKHSNALILARNKITRRLAGLPEH